MDLIKRGGWRVIRTDGNEMMLTTKPTIVAIQRAIHADGLDSVTLSSDRTQIMMCDDTGMVDGKPVNPKATALYRSICKPGTLHSIHGDVAIVNDEDFA